MDVACSLAMKDIPYKPKYKVTLYFPDSKIRREKKRSFLTKEVKLVPLRNNKVFFIFILNDLKIDLFFLTSSICKNKPCPIFGLIPYVSRACLSYLV